MRLNNELPHSAVHGNRGTLSLVTASILMTLAFVLLAQGGDGKPLPPDYSRYEAVVFTSRECPQCREVEPMLAAVAQNHAVLLVYLPDTEGVRDRLLSAGVNVPSGLPAICLRNGAVFTGARGVAQAASDLGRSNDSNRAGQTLRISPGPVVGFLAAVTVLWLWFRAASPAPILCVIAFAVAFAAIAYKAVGTCPTCSTGPSLGAPVALSVLALGALLVAWLPAMFPSARAASIVGGGLSLIAQFGGLIPLCAPCFVAGMAVLIGAFSAPICLPRPSRAPLAVAGAIAAVVLIPSNWSQLEQSENAALAPEGTLVDLPNTMGERARLIVDTSPTCSLCGPILDDVQYMRTDSTSLSVSVRNVRTQTKAQHLNPLQLTPAAFIVVDHTVIASMIGWGFATRENLLAFLNGETTEFRYWSFGRDNIGYAYVLSPDAPAMIALKRLRTSAPLIVSVSATNGGRYEFACRTYDASSFRLEESERSALERLVAHTRRYVFLITVSGFLTCPPGTGVEVN